MRLGLKLAICAAGKSQRQVAAETNLISENRLSEIIRGWAEPRSEERSALAGALGMDVGVLFDDPTPAALGTPSVDPHPTANPRSV